MENTLSSLLNELDRLPLSMALRKALRISQQSGASGFADWCRLELEGYSHSNSAMTNDVTVPEYRTVVGQHSDIYGRILQLRSDEAVVGETRLRYGTEELEALIKTRDVVVIHDPFMCELIRKHLGVEVYSFSFSSVHVTGILSAIRTELMHKLLALNDGGTSEPVVVANRAENIGLRPDLHNIEPLAHGECASQFHLEAVTWDVFISHASEDKDTVVIPLAKGLRSEGLRVWLDQQELTLGDSLRLKIDEGLRASRYGIVVLSHYFFCQGLASKRIRCLSGARRRQAKSYTSHLARGNCGRRSSFLTSSVR